MVETNFRVPTDDIAYIEASGNYCDVYLFNGESVTMTFQLHYFVEAFNKLRQNFFTRAGKSLIVKTNYVYAIIPAKTNTPITTNTFFIAFLYKIRLCICHKQIVADGLYEMI